MNRRAVVTGVFAAATAGCTDRIHDVAASTPRDLGVRSRYLPDDPLVAAESVRSRPKDMITHVVSARSEPGATAMMRPDAAEARAFAEATSFVDDGGEAVLVVAQRLTAPGVDLRLGSVSRVGTHSLRVAIDEVGHRPGDDDPTVQTLLIRLADSRGAPERVVVSVGGERAGVTI
ncbi:MAG: hypothetical protein PPP55_03070 [Halorubrum sp.]